MIDFWIKFWLININSKLLYYTKIKGKGVDEGLEFGRSHQLPPYDGELVPAKFFSLPFFEGNSGPT